MSFDLGRYPYLELIGMPLSKMMGRYQQIKAGRVTDTDRARLAAAEAKRQRRAGMGLLLGAALGVSGVSLRRTP